MTDLNGLVFAQTQQPVPVPEDNTLQDRIIAAAPSAQATVSGLLATRGKTHGDFTDHARITQNLKLAMWNTRPEGWQKLTPEQCEALEMIAHKIGRILAGDPDFKDHWDDIAGYAQLASDRVK